MALNIPIDQTSSSIFRQNIIIEDINLTMRFRYSTRTASWYMSLETEDYNIDNLRIVENYPLLKQHKALFPVFDGDFITLKVSEKAINEINYDNFGIDWILLYFTESELDDWYNYYSIDRE